MKRPPTQSVCIETSIYEKLIQNDDIPNLKWFVTRAINEKIAKNEKLEKNPTPIKHYVWVRIEKPIYEKLKAMKIKNMTWYISRAVEEKLKMEEEL